MLDNVTLGYPTGLDESISAPDKSALKEFTTIDNRHYKLAIVSENFMGKIREIFLYVTTDMKYYSSGTYSGGTTGAGVSDYGGNLKEKSQYTFVKWY